MHSTEVREVAAVVGGGLFSCTCNVYAFTDLFSIPGDIFESIK
jgi:hypothetical protein